MNLTKYITIEIMALFVVANVFSACNKVKEVQEQDSVTIQKIDPNILHGVDIAKMAEEPCFNAYADACHTFVENTPDFTAEEIARFEELLRLLQEALNCENSELAEKYANMIVNFFYKTDDINIGREKLEVFRNKCDMHLKEIGNLYPEFAVLSDNEKLEVLDACFGQKHQKLQQMSCKQACDNDYYLSGNVNATILALELLGCTFTLAGAGICIGFAVASYAASMGTAKYQHSNCLARC